MNPKTKMKLFYALEIAVWLLVIVLCVGSIRIHQAKKTEALPTYRIFMQDVDGLIEGSSVRLMGVPIGYVKSISIVQDQVYVKFVLTDKDMKLPQGVIATVEFNGMAGSKSLEIYPADEESKASGKLITIKKTNRLGAALGLFDDMFAKLDSILIRCGHFSEGVEAIMAKEAPIEGDVHRKTDMEAPITFVNNVIKKYNENRVKFMERLKPKHKPEIKEIIEDNQSVEEGISDGQ